MAQTPAAGQRGWFGGLGRGFLGGLLFGGLLGWMFGSGFGGAAGLLAMILQLGLIALLAMFLIRVFAGWSPRASLAGGGSGPSPMSYSNSVREDRSGARQPSDLRPSSMGGYPSDEIGITSSDLDRFEQLLGEIQSAFGREDFTGFRSRTTPEVMSYLAEELGQNAARGVHDEVSDVKLLQGDLSESWREDDTDYATVAMRYRSRDIMRDRSSGKQFTDHVSPLLFPATALAARLCTDPQNIGGCILAVLPGDFYTREPALRAHYSVGPVTPAPPAV